jgi:acetyl esterase
MPIAPELDAVLAHYATLPAVIASGDPIEQGRATHERDAVYFTPQRFRSHVATVEDRQVGAPSIPVRVYRPQEALTGPVPTVLWIHGGGWVTGSLHTADTLAREVAAKCAAVVVSVDYRMAPEYPWPAGLDDIIEAFGWMREHIDGLGGDADRMAVGGDSAGGNLAAVLAQEALDAGWPLRAQLLVYPVTDCNLDAGYPSRTQHIDGPYVTWGAVVDCIEHYTPGGVDRDDPRVSPIKRGSLRGLAPAVVATMELDPLRDEGSAYAAALAGAGVRAVHVQGPGLPHGAFDMIGRSATAAGVVQRTLTVFRELLHEGAGEDVGPIDADAVEAIPVRFLHPAKAAMPARARVSPDVAERMGAAVAGMDRGRYRHARGRLARAAREAAEDLLGEESFADAVRALPWSDGDRIIALGDSITDDSCSWAEQLRAVLAITHPGVTVLNHGVTGATTQDHLSRIDLVCRDQPSWVLQLLGTNDVRRQGSRQGVRMAEISETTTNLTKLGALITGEAGARLVRMTPPPVYDELLSRWEPFLAEQISWRAADIAEVAAAVRAQDPGAIDVHAAFASRRTSVMLPDGVHPNVAGQKLILQTVIAGLSLPSRTR